MPAACARCPAASHTRTRFLHPSPLLPSAYLAQASEEGGSSKRLKTGLALSAARAWRKLTGEPTEEVRWLPTGCLHLLDTLQQVGQ